ncbi:MAG: hypothetical protein GX573_23800, partial [Chloroflexi bacterium]|nr:hypothetical protein [Chloroflexota bacterium]
EAGAQRVDQRHDLIRAALGLSGPGRALGRRQQYQRHEECGAGAEACPRV